MRGAVAVGGHEKPWKMAAVPRLLVARLPQRLPGPALRSVILYPRPVPAAPGQRRTQASILKVAQSYVNIKFLANVTNVDTAEQKLRNKADPIPATRVNACPSEKVVNMVGLLFQSLVLPSRFGEVEPENPGGNLGLETTLEPKPNHSRRSVTEITDLRALLQAGETCEYLRRAEATYVVAIW